MKNIAWTLLCGVVAPALLGGAEAWAAPEGHPPAVILDGVSFTLKVTDPDLGHQETRTVEIQSSGPPQTVVVPFGDGIEVSGLLLESGDQLVLIWQNGGETARTSVATHILPGWTSVLPPLVAILLAIIFRQVVVALLVGVWLGAVMVYMTNPFHGFLRAFDVYVIGAVADRDHVTILVFSFLLGGMLGIIQRTGGSKGIVALVSPRARSARSGQITTWFMGLVIFFDDYANSLLVGSTMRPLTDRLKISREKLAYIVDSTAAPVTSIAIVSTWIGVEVGLIQASFADLGIERDAFATFLASIPYRFYPIFALVFGFMVAVMGRDFGPMLKAERRARSTGKVLRDGAMPLSDFDSQALQPPEGKPIRWQNAAFPILVMIAGVLIFIYTGGRQAAMAAGDSLDLKTIVGSADSYAALLWASALGSVTALLMAVGQRILSLNQAVDAWVQGMKSMIIGMLILTLAWAIGAVAADMHTADFLVEVLGANLNARWIPAIVFILSGLTSFATGSSWGAMGLLMPLVIPLAHGIAPGNEVILVGSISSVLAGSVWGDHCSPISDTTVLSSMASASDHVDHVNTQLPYALLVGGVGVLIGDLATAFGLNVWVAWAVGIAILWSVLRFLGKKSEVPSGA